MATLCHHTGDQPTRSTGQLSTRASQQQHATQQHTDLHTGTAVHCQCDALYQSPMTCAETTAHLREGLARLTPWTTPGGGPDEANKLREQALLYRVRTQKGTQHCCKRTVVPDARAAAAKRYFTAG
jgi:hypothetical protein